MVASLDKAEVTTAVVQEKVPVKNMVIHQRKTEMEKLMNTNEFKSLVFFPLNEVFLCYG